MADYDLPAIFTYVNGITKQKVSYIGHSQGTMQMHIALSKRNAVVENLIDKYFGFGPVAYVQHSTSNIVDLLDHKVVLEWFKLRGIHEFMPGLKWFETDAGILFCSSFPKVCGDAIGQICDADP
jgi:gastric triacylglycerol lipase